MRNWQELIQEEAEELLESIQNEGFESTHTIHEFLDLAMCIKLIPTDLLQKGYDSHKRKCLLKGYSTAIQDRFMTILGIDIHRNNDSRLTKQFAGHPTHFVKGVLVLGAPGAGKSTLVSCLNKLYPYDVALDLDNIIFKNTKDKWVVEPKFLKFMLFMYPIVIGSPYNWKELEDVAKPSIGKIVIDELELQKRNIDRKTPELIQDALSMNRALQTSPYPETNFDELNQFADLLFTGDYDQIKFDTMEGNQT